MLSPEYITRINMGFFSFFGTIKARADIESVVEKLLEIQVNNGTFSANPKQVATLCMLGAWKNFPDVFNGNFGQRPHRLIGASVGIATIINTTERENKDFRGLLMAFFTVLSEIETNKNYYPFSNIDYEMLNRITPIIESETKAFNEQYGELANQLTSMMSNYKKT